MCVCFLFNYGVNSLNETFFPNIITHKMIINIYFFFFLEKMYYKWYIFDFCIYYAHFLIHRLG